MALPPRRPRRSPVRGKAGPWSMVGCGQQFAARLRTPRRRVACGREVQPSPADGMPAVVHVQHGARKALMHFQVSQLYVCNSPTPGAAPAAKGGLADSPGHRGVAALMVPALRAAACRVWTCDGCRRSLRLFGLVRLSHPWMPRGDRRLFSRQCGWRRKRRSEHTTSANRGGRRRAVRAGSRRCC